MTYNFTNSSLELELIRYAQLNLSAEDWIWLPPPQLLDLIQANLSNVSDSWPWINILPSQFAGPVRMLQMTIEAERVSKLVPLIICPLGILGSLCSLAAFWHKGVRKRVSFYIWMLWIALFDLLFTIGIIPMFVGRWTQFNGGNVYRYSYSSMQAMQILYGIVFTFSLNSDLCTIGLTIERFLGICKPLITLTTPVWKKRVAITTGIFIVVICNVARFVRYAFQNEAGENPVKPEEYIYVDTALGGSLFFTGLSQFTDLLLPILLLVPMLYMSIMIALVVIRRRRASVRDHIDSENRKNQLKSTAMLRLLVVLVLLFMLSQIGYCLYAISFAFVQTKTVNYESSYDELMSYLVTNFVFSVAMVICNLAECASRSLNFFLYYCFSVSARKQFMRAIKLSRCRK